MEKNKLKELLEKAFNAGRTVNNYKGSWIYDLNIDDYTEANFRTFDDWWNENADNIN